MEVECNADDHLYSFWVPNHLSKHLAETQEHSFLTLVSRPFNRSCLLILLFVRYHVDPRARRFIDFIDPCSGLPMITLNCNKVYSEVDGMECLLGFKAYSAGFCKILTHPVWGSAVYPATIFLHAPRDCIIRLLEEEYAACQGRHG